MPRPAYLNQLLRPRYDVRSGLVGWWPLGDETIADWGGRGQGATTVTAVTTTDGPRGERASKFNGTSSFIFAGNSSLFLQGPFSAAFWINTTTAVTGNFVVVAASDGGANHAYVITFSYPTAPSAVGKLALWNTASGPDVASTSTVNDGNWHHAVVTRSGTTGSWPIAFYIDGKLDNSGTATTNPAGTAQQFAISRFGSFNGYFIGASLRDVRIYNRALSAQEAHAIYSAGPETIEPMIIRAAAAAGAKFRRTDSMLGTRTGSRQVWAA